MKTLVQYFEEKKNEGQIIRLWTNENYDGVCEYVFVQEVLVNQDGSLYGILTTEDLYSPDDGYLIKVQDINCFTCLYSDQQELEDEDEELFDDCFEDEE